MQCEISCEFAVIGGGMAGLCAALTAARRGVKTVLLSDRPVLGGNASGEVRMWIRGASDRFPAYREGGILEELALDTARHNASMRYPLWDALLYGKAAEEKNLTLLLNTVCLGAEEEDGKITRITAFGLTNYIRYTITAPLFADCSGDCILAETTSAEVMQGRETEEAFGESLAPKEKDACTMGNSVLIQARETDGPVSFTPPPFAKKFTKESFRARLNLGDRMGFIRNNYWWIELGGTDDTLRDAEKIKHDLLATAFGVWDFVKNGGYFDAENWELDFVGFLPAKRETRRYRGKYILTQNDLDALTPFPDEIAYGGWTMDDHDPAGFYAARPNEVRPTSAPYPIPYRCLISNTLENLAFAGRNISVSHVALTSCRVMATCALEGHAVGEAAVLALKYSTNFHGVETHIKELQQLLRDDDLYLLHTPRNVSKCLHGAEISPAWAKKILLDGIERETDGGGKIVLPLGTPLTITFEKTHAEKIRLVFDSDIARACQKDREIRMYPQRCHLPKGAEAAVLPPCLIRSFLLEVRRCGVWVPLLDEEDNFKRLRFCDVGGEIDGIRLTGRRAGENYPSLSLFSIDILA